MDGYQPASYGDAIADVYDTLQAIGPPDELDAETEAAVAFLTRGAADGLALELGVGTGRIAIPLAARGVDVVGVDASAAMVTRLRAKPGGDRVTVYVADMADLPVDGPFDLVYVVASTLYCLTSQAAQVACVRAAARRLRPGGWFVVEAFTPDPGRFDRGQRVHVRAVDATRVRFDLAVHDAVGQTVSAQQLLVDGDGVRLMPVHVRYIWPAELDLMAALAGLEPTGRWGGWRQEPYTAASGRHVSVYRRPAR